MSSNFSGNLADWLQPGKKEARERAQIVQKRRFSAAAAVSDMEQQLNDAVFGLELDKTDYQASDVTAMQAPFDRARQVISSIYHDLTDMNNTPVPAQISEMEAYQLMQPVLRVESRLNEVRNYLTQGNELKTKYDLPKQNAKGQVDTAERKRLNTASTLPNTRNFVQQMQSGRAENAPEMAAAFLTAERETTAATQLVQAAQQALSRKGWRDAVDLSDRACRMLDSAQERLRTIEIAGEQFAHAASDAQALLDSVLQKLQEAKVQLTAKAALLSNEPNDYLQYGVQQIGEARRALKQNPPQALAAYRLATEANTLIEEAVTQASEEVQRLKNNRLEARKSLQELQEAVQTARSQLSSQRVVPVAANELYKQARSEYEQLYDTKVDELKSDELERTVKVAKAAIRLAQQATKMLPPGP